MLAYPKRSALLSGFLHAGAIALVLLATNPRTGLVVVKPVNEIGKYITIAPFQSKRAEGGGGGGARDDTPPRQGPLPRASRRQFVPPTLHLIQFEPKLAMEATILASPEATMRVPDYGVPDGVLGSWSAGPGINGGIGPGNRGGAGSGNGPGAGPGDHPDGGVAGFPRSRGTVVNPALLSKVEPEYSEEARRAKVQGTVLLRVEVNERGQVQNILVRQSLGLGLDERAIEAVRRWRFRAGSVDGRPAVMSADIEVNFRLL